VKDERLYAKFTLDFPDSPKIMPLPVEAKWALVEMTIYSRRLLTDGFLSKPLALAKWGLDVCSALLDNDPEKPSLVEVENGYQIRDFAEHQTTKAEIEALTAKRKAAGSKGGQASAQAKAKQKGSKSNPETETETETVKRATPNGVVGAQRKRGTRLAADWMPPQDAIDAMKHECPDVDLKTEHRKFIDYWTDQTGAKGVKASWVGTWRNWIRRAAENQPRAPAGASNVSAFQRKTANNAAVFEALADDHRPPELLA
jgi:hypothetical protein